MMCPPTLHEDQAAYAKPPRPIAQPKELADLKAQNVLTDAEFEAQKAHVLA
jgi:hypothetical protein